MMSGIFLGEAPGVQPQYGGTFSSQDLTGTGDNSWSNPSNAAASDDSYAAVSVGIGNHTYHLVLDHLGFALPTNAIVASIAVDVEASSTGTVNGFTSLTVFGWYNSTRYSSLTKFLAGTNNTDVHYRFFNSDTFGINGGSPATYLQINDTSFGVTIEAELDSGAGSNDTVSVDFVKVTVYYTYGPYPMAATSLIHCRAVQRAAFY